MLFFRVFLFAVIALSGFNFLLGNDTSIDDVKKAISQFRETNARAITLNDYDKLIANRMPPIPKQYQPEIWKELKASQNSRPSLQDISKLIKSKKDSITSLKQRYSFMVYDCSNKNKVLAQEVSVEHIYSKEKIYQKIKSKDARKNTLNMWQDISFDGQFLRTVDYPFKYPLKGSIPNASISLLDNRSILFFQENLLRLTMLYNSKDFSEAPNSGMDLAYLIDSPACIIFETPVQMDGRECVLLSDGIHRVYLCPEMDYAVVREDVYVTDRKNPLRGVVTKKRRYASYVSKDFVSYENGLWFPAKVESVTFDDNGNELQKTVTVFEEILVNSSIASSLFENIIPDDAIVFDGVRKMTYKYGDRASIGDLLKDTVKSKRVMIFRYISVTVGLLMIIAALFMKYRNYRKQKEVS